MLVGFVAPTTTERSAGVLTRDFSQHQTSTGKCRADRGHEGELVGAAGGQPSTPEMVAHSNQMPGVDGAPPEPHDQDECRGVAAGP